MHNNNNDNTWNQQSMDEHYDPNQDILHSDNNYLNYPPPVPSLPSYSHPEVYPRQMYPYYVPQIQHTNTPFTSHPIHIQQANSPSLIPNPPYYNQYEYQISNSMNAFADTPTINEWDVAITNDMATSTNLNVMPTIQSNFIQNV